MSKIKQVAKVKRIMIWPARTINLGNYNSAKLSAGIEMEFDESVDVGSEEVAKAFLEARKIVREELKLQYEPYKKILIKNKE